MPPHIHNLPRLAEIANLPLDVKNRKVLAEINEFNIEGRYSDLLSLSSRCRRQEVTCEEQKEHLNG